MIKLMQRLSRKFWNGKFLLSQYIILLPCSCALSPMKFTQTSSVQLETELLIYGCLNFLAIFLNSLLTPFSEVRMSEWYHMIQKCYFKYVGISFNIGKTHPSTILGLITSHCTSTNSSIEWANYLEYKYFSITQKISKF